jgi:hypothetical protein
MLLPVPPDPGFAAATADVENPPLTQSPDAEAVELAVPPKGVSSAHETVPVFAEVNPLPPTA